MPAKAGCTSGRYCHWQTCRFAEKRGGNAARGHINQCTMTELDALERRAVVGHRDVVLSCTVDKVEHTLGQPLLGSSTQVPDVEASIKAGHHTVSITRSNIRLPWRHPKKM